MEYGMTEWWNGGTVENHLKSKIKDGMTERWKITPNPKRQNEGTMDSHPKS